MWGKEERGQILSCDTSLTHFLRHSPITPLRQIPLGHSQTSPEQIRKELRLHLAGTQWRMDAPQVRQDQHSAVT